MDAMDLHNPGTPLDPENRMPANIVRHFQELADPRVVGRCDHKLVDIIAITIAAACAGMKTWENIELFAEEREDWFRTWLELPCGIPSHDTFRRFFAKLGPVEFAACFEAWARQVAVDLHQETIHIDGKTVRGSGDRKKNLAPLHLVNAWASNNGLVLGCRKVDGHESEAQALPELLRSLEIAGAIVTYDAGGCYKEVADEIRERGADYVICLKGNQAGLFQEAKDLFSEAQGEAFDDCAQGHARTEQKGHGREEIRDYWLIRDSNQGGRKSEWRDLRCFGKVRSTRIMDGTATVDERYYITSLPCKVKRFAEAVRKHWEVENVLHWSLDMSYDEDSRKNRTGHLAENLAILNRGVLPVVRKTVGKNKYQSAPSKQMTAALKTEFLEEILRNF